MNTPDTTLENKQAAEARKIADTLLMDDVPQMSVRRRIAGLMVGFASLEWRPIDTAPVGGNIEVDLWANGSRYTNCHKHFDDWLYWASDSVDEEPTWKRVENPTHWMRIPPGPR